MSDADVVSDRTLPFAREAGRKAIHLLGLVLPLGYRILGRDRALPFFVVILIVVVGGDVARLAWPAARRLYDRIFGAMTRRSEARRFTGASMLVISQTVAAALFPAAVVPAAMSFGIVGDVAAALVGRRFGRLHWRPGKSVEGSVACLVAAFLGGMMWGQLSWGVVLGGAVAATLAEGLLDRIDDNLAIPLIGGLAMSWLGM